VNDLGAFSVKFPSVPKKINKVIDNPLDKEGDPYYINLYLSSDMKTANNYIVRYNDMPFGYYMNDPEKAFEGLKKSFKQKAKIIKTDTISYKGYHGRQYELLFSDKYHTICKVYYRGNRLYLLMHQNLNETDKVSSNSDFFNSFSFEEYKGKNLKKYTTDLGHKIKAFERIEVNHDSTDTDTFVSNVSMYQTLNESSGAIYQFEVSEVKDFYRISSLQSYYDKFIDLSNTWTDSVMKPKDIKIGKLKGKEFYLFNKRSKMTSRHRIWLDDKYIFYKYIYSANEELDSEITNDYFDYFEKGGATSNFDIGASKTEAIIAGLKSKDTLVFNKSDEALNYYNFEKEDINFIHENLFYQFKNEDSINGPKCKLIRALSEINDSLSLAPLKKLFKLKNANSNIRAAILEVLPNLNHEDRLQVYLELLLESPPVNDDISYWEMLQPLKDSVSFSVKNIKSIIPILNEGVYREQLLSLFSKVSTDSVYRNIITTNFKEITTYLKEDFNTYELSVSSEKYSGYDGKIYNYLSIMDNLESDFEAIDWFTKKIISLNNDSSEWYRLLAIKLRLKNNLSIEKEVLKKSLERTFSRYDVMKALDESKQFKIIPKKYLKLDGFSELCFINYLIDNDEEPEEVELLGEVFVKKKKYFVYSFHYNESHAPKEYIGVAGPIEEGKYIKKVDKIDSYTNWNALGVNWEKQAKEIVIDSLKE